MRIGLMGEGQDGLTWERWRHVLGLAEIQFQHFLFERDDVPQFLAEAVAPQVAGIQAGDHS